MDFNTIWTFAKPIIAGQVRTALAGVAGALAASGAIQGSQTTEFVSMGTGIVLYAIPAAWSWWEKCGKIRLIALMAKSRPVAPPNATIAEAVKAATVAPPIIKAEVAK